LIDADSANRIYPSQAVTRGKLADIIYRMIKLNGGMLPIQKLRAEQLVSIFENNTTKFQYAYSENLNDGRGITAGIAGFTTANGDGYAVVKRYTQLEPSNPLSPYLATLKQLAADESDDTSQLSGYGDAWKVAANDPVFRRVQDEIMDEDYYNPAMKHADELGLSFPLSRAVLFDSIIQHGDGEDPDGLPALIARTNAKMGGSPGTGVDEKDWLKGFLQVRMDDLTNPSDPTTKDVWAASVGRAQVLLKIADDGNYELKGPIVVNAVDYQGTTN
jgi:chitosanase